MKLMYGGLLAAAALIMTGGAANAALVETVTVANTFGFNFTSGGSVEQTTGGTRETVFLGQRFPIPESDLGVDYVGEADKGSFFFLHNNYCVGACSTGSQTVITFSVTNTGDAPVNLRFDSLITPGHLARLDGTAPARGGFNFSVTQRGAGVDDVLLYNAFGNANDEELSVANSLGTEFNDQVMYDLPNGRVLDWSTTPLNLELGLLAAGATTAVVYDASYFITSFETCQDIITCGGLQIVFGDPRNNGSIGRMARALGDPVAIINREYDAFSIPYAFNLSGSPFPDLPPAQGPVTYDRGYDPIGGTVPEPSTWASLIVGMALIAGVLRRRRRSSVDGVAGHSAEPAVASHA